MNMKFAFPIVAAALSLGAMACSGQSEEFDGDGDLAGGEAVEDEAMDEGGLDEDGQALADIDELGSLGQALVPTSCGGTPPSVGTLTVNSSTPSQTLTTSATYGIPSCPKVARIDLSHFGVSAGITVGYDPTASLPTNQTDCQKIEVSRVTMQNANGTVVLGRTSRKGSWTGTTCIRPITSSTSTVASGQHFEWVQSLDHLGNTKKARVTLTRVP